MAEPLVPIPGGNLFISGEDLTSEPDATGTRLIHCTPISDSHSGSLAAKGTNILRRLLIGLAE